VKAEPQLNPDGVSIKGCTTIYAPGLRANEYAGLALNPYRGCGYGCLYCYVVGILALQLLAWAKRNGREMDKLEGMKIAEKEFRAGAKEQLDFKVHFLADLAKYELIGSHEQVFMSFTADMYHLGDTSLTRWVIEQLHAHGMAHCILTKGGLLSLRDIDLYRPEWDAYALTLTNLDAEFTEKWERNTASPEDRINAAIRFKERGIYVWGSIEPVYDCARALEVIRQYHWLFDHVKVGPLSIENNKLAPTAVPTPEEYRKFVPEMLELCDKHGLKVYIKKHLQKYVPEGRKAHNESMMRLVQNKKK